MFATGHFFGPASPNQIEPSPYSTGTSTVVDGSGIRTGSITTANMTAGTINGDRITANTLDASKIAASSVLSNTITVDGTSLGSTTSNAAIGAQNPATRINNNTTLINPGQILIAGSTTLDSWRDVTEIRGGAIKANTVTAEKLIISSQASNLVVNSDFQNVNPITFQLGGRSMGQTPGLGYHYPFYAIPGSKACYMEWSGSNWGPGHYADITVQAPNIDGNPVHILLAQGGDVNGWTFEVSVSVSCHRCHAELYAIFTNGLNYLGQINCTPNNLSDGMNGSNLLKPPWRMRGTGVAPPGTTHAYIIMRQIFTGEGASPYTFFSGLHFGVCNDVNYITPWSPRSATEIHGSQITTGTLNANRIRANTIDSTQLRTDVAVITQTAQIANLVVATAHIQDLSVGTLKIANSAISGGSAAAYNVGPNGYIELYYNVRPGAILLLTAGAHNHAESNVDTPGAQSRIRAYTLTSNYHGDIVTFYAYNFVQWSTPNGLPGGYYWVTSPSSFSMQRVWGPGLAVAVQQFYMYNRTGNNAEMFISILETVK
jgi:hypothetical protein